MSSLTDLVAHQGYLGIFLLVGVEGFGIPAPGEAAIILGAGYAAPGHLAIAGATGMPWRRFVVYNVLGAAAWVGVWATAGLPRRRPPPRR